MLKIGSHVSFSGKGLLNAATEAISYGSSSFMVYTGAPQNTRRKPIEEQFIEEGRALMAEHGIEDIIVHAPYIINLASYKGNTFRLAVDFLQAEMRRTEHIGVRNIVLHPGAYTDKDPEYGIARIAEGLNEVLSACQDIGVHVALETMAGKGTEIGRSFEELAQIIDKVEHNDRLTVCFDTCHVHDAGYDIVDDLDGVLAHFDQVIGLERIAVLHLNDSKNFRGAGKDRHAPLGSGLIGYEAIKRIVNHEQLKHLPMVLETPWIGKEKKSQRPMYEVEIALLKDNMEERFDSGFFDDVAKFDHYFSGESIDRHEFINSTWDMLRHDAKSRKADPREPLERLFDLVMDAELVSDLSEEAINQRIVAWLAGYGGKE